jgi:hypothetical protein
MTSSTPRSRIIFLTGAPLEAELQSPRDQLLDELDSPVYRFLNDHLARAIPDPPPSHAWPNWRALQQEDKSVNRKDAKRKRRAKEQLSFLSTNSVQSKHDVDHDFLEHSLAVYAGAEQTELAPNPSFDQSTSLQESFLSEFTDEPSILPVVARTTTLPSFVTNLKGLPRASEIEKSYPQTITVDLIVGVISVAPARSVQLRRVPRMMELVELIVGDETSTGFSISFWLFPEATVGDYTRMTLEKLRSRHVVLLTNVALRVWQGHVYGQSLNRRVSRNETFIERLDSSKRMSGGQFVPKRLPTLLQNKLDRVETWVSHFLYTADETVTKPGHTSTNTNLRSQNFLADQSELPPDTQ